MQPRNILNAARAISKKRYEAARKLEKLVEAEINDLAMKSSFPNRSQRHRRRRELDRLRLRPGRVYDRDQSRRAAAAAGADCFRWRIVARDAGSEGKCRSWRRARKRSSRAPQRTLVFDEIDTGIGGRAAEAVGKKLKSSVPLESGSLRHPPAADRHLRRSSLPDREEGRRRPNEDHRPPDHRRRAHRGSRPHAQRRQADRHLAQARRADAQDQRVGSTTVRCPELPNHC